MAITKQIPLAQKTNTYAWRGINPLGTVAVSDVPVCTNGYFEVSKEALSDSRKVAYCKRPGVNDFEYITTYTDLKCTNTGEKIRGLCTSLDKTQVLYFTRTGSARYSNIWDSATDNVTQTDITATFSDGDYVFTVLDNIHYGSGVNYAVTNGTDGGLVSSTGVWSKITDADYTGNGTKTNFVGLDGYLFYGVISGTNAGRIYNSELGAAAAASGWVSTSYLSANDVPGQIVWLARIRNLIVCFKQYSIEFFEDVGNPTPGSPLEPRRQYTKRIGCASASSIQEVSDGLIFLGVDGRGKMAYWKLDKESLELRMISDPHVNQAVQGAYDTAGGYRAFSHDYSVTLSIRGQSQVIIWRNKEFYMTTIPSAWDGTPISMVYDNELDIWVRWTTSFVGDGASDGVFVPSQCFLLNNNNGGFDVCFANNYPTTGRFSIMYMANQTDSPKAFQDQYELSASNIHNFVFVWQSDFIDFGTTDRKFLHAIDVVYDSDPDQTTSSLSTQTLKLQHFDQDYNQAHPSISTFREITIDNAGWRRAIFRQLGSFRRKAFKLWNASAYPLRIWAIELTIDHGPDNA